ncbi:MAG: hypothetical protein K0S46_1091 [Moraxellaceae bacterium]|jgi:hypothetical protein|nr:hypothetical protein [Moraxellaceae bacterium]
MPFTPTPAVAVALVASGLFFLTGLLTGVWKYLAMAGSDKAEAPYYVNIAHRSSLMYAFAAQLLAVFAALSAWSATVNVWAALLPVLFFGAAIFTYVLHGLLRDTDNQLARPHRLGPLTLPGVLLHGFMGALIVGEIGGFLVLFAGLLRTLALI